MGEGRVDVVWVGWYDLASVQWVSRSERRAGGFCVVLVTETAYAVGWRLDEAVCESLVWEVFEADGELVCC